MKAQVTLSLDPLDIRAVEQLASKLEISRSAWLRRAIRRQIIAELPKMEPDPSMGFTVDEGDRFMTALAKS